VPDNSSHQRYVIRRKGSFYNITGPDGRLFRKYQSARVVGPRWEELTHTPWPYASSAYEPGLRLWQLGLIDREQVGQSEADIVRPITQAATISQHRNEIPRIVILPSVLALPAPRIDLQEQARLMQTLRRDPKLLFNPTIRETLRREVEYHLPQARWAAHLLRLLDRYDRRQRQRERRPIVSEGVITARHVAWQEQHLAPV
jgi:hypothetical protein